MLLILAMLGTYENLVVQPLMDQEGFGMGVITLLILFQIMVALHAVQIEGHIYHRDIKSKNILLASNQQEINKK